MTAPPQDQRTDWGVDLWDKNDVLIKHMKKGGEFCGQLKEYFSELASIEIEYSQKLRRLHDKCFSSKKQSEMNDDDIKFTHVEAFREVSNEVSVMANQHAEIGDKLNAEVVKVLKAYLKEFKADSHRIFQDAEKCRKELESYRNQLDKSQERYGHAHRDTIKATELFRKTDQDVKAAKIDVEKCRSMMNTRQAEEDKLKQEYAEQQQSFNRRQRDYYQMNMPNIHRGVQQLEEKRILRIQEMLQRVHACHHGVIGIIQKCIANMATHTMAINPSNDLLATVRKYESGEKPPGDVAFFDLSPSAQRHAEFTPMTPQSHNGDTLSPGNSSASLSHPMRPARGQRAGSIKGHMEDFSDQPPAQQVRRLRGRIDELEKEVDKQRKACEGLVRMLDTFKTNEKGGDIVQTEKMLEEQNRQRQKAEDELEKFKGYLAEAQQRLASASGSSLGGGDTSSRVSTPRSSHAAPAQMQLSAVSANATHIDDEFDDEFDDEPPEMAMRAMSFNQGSSPETCRALYDYNGEQPGTLRMQKGEQFEVVERDPAGDQWTKVQRKSPPEIGFVPTQYISIESSI